MECANFRDTGGYVDLIADACLMHTGKLFRSGKIDAFTPHELGSPLTILNLRRGKDPVWPSVDMFHVAADNRLDNYNTAQSQTRRWLNRVLRVLISDRLRLPVLVHCAFGKDPTGIVIAAVLWLLKIPQQVIVQEYLLSNGDVCADWVAQALLGFESNPDDFGNSASPTFNYV